MGGMLQRGERAGVHVYNLPKRWEMPHWIESEAKKQGGKIEPDAAARLSEMVGEDTRIAAQELTKLLTYVNFERPRPPAGRGEGQHLSARRAASSSWSTRSVKTTGRRPSECCINYWKMKKPLNCGAWSSASSGCCSRRVKCWTNACAVPEIQKTLGLHEFVAQKVCSQAGRFSRCPRWSPFIINCWRSTRGPKRAGSRSTWRWIR